MGLSPNHNSGWWGGRLEVGRDPHSQGGQLSSH